RHRPACLGSYGLALPAGRNRYPDHPYRDRYMEVIPERQRNHVYSRPDTAPAGDPGFVLLYIQPLEPVLSVMAKDKSAGRLLDPAHRICISHPACGYADRPADKALERKNIGC